MKISYKEAPVNFSTIKKGEAFSYGAEIYMRTETVSDSDECLNAVHLGSGEMVYFGSEEKIKTLSNVEIVIS